MITIAMQWCFFQFSPEAEFTSPLQETPKQNQHASHKCYSVKNMLKLLAFKWLLNELLLETKLSEAMLIWWFVSIKFVGPFLKFSFLTWFFKRFPLYFQHHCKNCPFSIYRYHCGSTILLFFCFFPEKGIIFFVLPIF